MFEPSPKYILVVLNVCLIVIYFSLVQLVTLSIKVTANEDII